MSWCLHYVSLMDIAAALPTSTEGKARNLSTSWPSPPSFLFQTSNQASYMEWTDQGHPLSSWQFLKFTAYIIPLILVGTGLQFPLESLRVHWWEQVAKKDLRSQNCCLNSEIWFARAQLRKVTSNTLSFPYSAMCCIQKVADQVADS